MSTAFQAISVVGGVVPPSLLGRIQSGEVNDPKSLDPGSYHLIGTETVRDAASRSWGYLRTAWQSWREIDAKKRPEGLGAGIGDARQKWLLVLLREFGYGQVPPASGGLKTGNDVYPISHLWGSVPIHLLGPGVELDKRTAGVDGAAKRAPQAMVQEFLNRDGEHLWAILSNGLKLRLLRDSTALAGSAYIEFDLETIFDSDIYPEFQLLWQLCHQSRLDKRGGAEASPADCWLESWRAESVDAGARALDKLGDGVEKALDYLGTGFLRHPANGWLVDALHTGELSPRDFHKALLRTAYRILFCFVVEDRNALLHPDAPTVSRERYAKYFSTQRLRKLSRNRDGGPHPDLWRTQKLVLSALGGEGLEAVGLPALGGLFDPDSRARTLQHQPHEDLLLGAELANQDFLKAIRRLGWVVGKGERLQPVDYRHLGAEELGSVYESLLELIPRVDTETRSFELVRLAGNERKVTGSYYTPPSLVSALLDTALEPLLDEAVNGGTDGADKELRLLALTVCDPASGSGGFLVAAARRIARRLAEVRAGEDEPSPDKIQEALHDVVERCIYGVDMNDLAAELAKVSLWLEAMQPGKPLGFLDARIKIGNSLLCTTPVLLAGGVPDEAFGVLEGDDKKYAAEVKKRNRVENSKKADKLFGSLGQETFSFGSTTTGVAELIGKRKQLVKPVSTAAEARSRARAYAAFDHSDEMEHKRLHADAWCAAFVWPLNSKSPEPPTSSIVRQLGDAGESAGYADTVATVRQLADEYRFFHWHLEFPEVFGDPTSGDAGAEGWPGGFSCVLGNPPWERVKLQEQEFFAARHEVIAKAPNSAARTRLIKQLVDEDPILHGEFLKAKRKAEGQSLCMRASGRFPLNGRGDVNTYAVFAELFRSLTGPLGRSGVIVPTGIATDATTQHFFKDLVETSSIAALYDFENRVPLFQDVDSRFKFCLLTMAGRLAREEIATFAFFLHDPTEIATSAFALTPDEIKLLNPNTGTLPVFRTRRDAEITLNIYRRVPILINENDISEGNPWNLSFMRMFDMSNDSHLFHTREQLENDSWTLTTNIFKRTSTNGDEKMLPLHEGKMGHQFNSRFASFTGVGDTDISVLPAEGTELPLPRYWVSERETASRLSRRRFGTTSVLLGHRRVSRSTDERTSIAALLPWGAASYGWIISAGPCARELAALSCIYNSFLFDFCLRNALTQPSVPQGTSAQLPGFDPATFGALAGWDRSTTVLDWCLSRVVELTYRSIDLAAFAAEVGFGGPVFIRNPERDAQLRAELDAAIFHLAGQDQSDISHILDSFPVLRRKEEAQLGEYRTKRLVLDVFDAMQEAIDGGVPYATDLKPLPGQGPRHPATEKYE